MNTLQKKPKWDRKILEIFQIGFQHFYSSITKTQIV